MSELYLAEKGKLVQPYFIAHHKRGTLKSFFFVCLFQKAALVIKKSLKTTDLEDWSAAGEG